MTRCSHRYEAGESERVCPRPATSDHDRCVFHLSPAERREAEIGDAALRSAFLADVDDDPARREYVDAHLEGLDLSTLVIDGSDVGTIAFRSVSIDGTLDLSGSVLRHPVVVEDSRIDRVDLSGSSFEMDVTIEGTTVGGASATCLRARRGAFERNLELHDTRLTGGVEFAACRVRDWLDFDGVTVEGGAHFQNLSFGRAQFVATTFEAGAGFDDAAGDSATFDGVRTGDGARIDLTGASIELLRVYPDAPLQCRLRDATVSAGRLDQPADAVARYDLTGATVGDVALDCGPESFDRYRFYRTRFDGFAFPAYRDVLRANRWRLHEYVGTTEHDDDTEGLEGTYLEARKGAAESGDSETASMFFVREMRYRRQRYAAHAGDAAYSPAHRTDAGLRWLTNAFLDGVAGYGERPQRTAALALAVVLGSALTYPATGGLTSGDGIVRYATHGPAAALDGLYFSVVTFATLGLGDVHPVSDAGRFLVASEGLAGAFLTAVFVFSLGRRVTR